MAEDAIAAFQQRRRWLPAVSQAFFQEFVRTRTMIPDSDRCHDAESGHAEDDPALLPGHDQLVAILVLGDQVELVQRQAVRLHPGKDFFERGQIAELGVLCFGCHDRLNSLDHRLYHDVP